MLGPVELGQPCHMHAVCPCGRHSPWQPSAPTLIRGVSVSSWEAPVLTMVIRMPCSLQAISDMSRCLQSTCRWPGVQETLHAHDLMVFAFTVMLLSTHTSENQFWNISRRAELLLPSTNCFLEMIWVLNPRDSGLASHLSVKLIMYKLTNFRRQRHLIRTHSQTRIANKIGNADQDADFSEGEVSPLHLSLYPLGLSILGA